MGNYSTDHVLSAISSGNFTYALYLLGGKATDNLFECLKKTKINKVESLKLKIENGKNTEIIKKYTEQRHKIEEQIKYIEKEVREILKTDCLICYEPLKNTVIVPCCEKFFCAECLLECLNQNKNCPFCRCEIDTNNIYYVSSKERIHNRDKIDILMDILSSNPKGRFIIFASCNQSFKRIISEFKNRSMTYAMIKGTVDKIERTIQKFKSGDSKILLLNSEYNGAGINLQEASDIILYHDMDLDTKTQIVGRVNRIGRTGPLTVHQLLYKKRESDL